jgi:hypothetical protein
VPSLHFAVAPVGSVLPVVDLAAEVVLAAGAADLEALLVGAAVEGAMVVGAAAFEAEPLVEVLEAGGVAAGAEEEDVPAEAFCTPP